MPVKAAVWLLVLLACASAAAAQETRAAQLERERAAKARQLKPYEPSKLESLVVRVEEGRLRRLISPHNGFFVNYGYSHKPVGSGIGLSAGWRHDLFDRHARLVLEAGSSLRAYQMVRADFSLPRLAGQKLELGAEAVYRRQPQDDFYGLGLETTRDMRVSYRFQGRSVEGRAIVRPREWFEAGARVGHLATSIGSGTDRRFPSVEELFEVGAAPGLLRHPDYLYSSVFAAIDNRDEPGNARDGGYYSIEWHRYSDRVFDSFSFRGFDAHARHFLPIFDKKRVFALQAALLSATPDSGHEVPFYMQPWLGGGHSLRSVADYRFRDRSIFHFNAEYRWEAFAALDMALFGDFGTVARRVSDLDLGDLKRAYGIGFRFNTAGAVLFRIDIATGGGEGVRYYFKFSNAF
jgi:hypothetical protein